jgi:transcriptional/translational regulatory protein YebC/TACO1
MFDRKGIFTIEAAGQDPDELELELIDGGAEDLDFDEENQEFIITVAFEDFGNMQKKLEELSIEPKSAVLERIPSTTNTLDIHDAKKALHLIEALEEDDDVQAVFHNLEMTEELEAELMAED